MTKESTCPSIGYISQLHVPNINVSRPASLSAIRKLRKESFQTGLKSNGYETGRGINDYLKELPEFQSKNVVEHIKNFIKNNTSCSVLDVGCGSAIFLKQLAKSNFRRIKASGLSAFDYRNSTKDSEKFSQAILNCIDYRIGDAQKIIKIFPDNKFDFIVSVNAFNYFGDPLNVLKSCYSLLRPNGIAFIDYMTGGKMPNVEVQKLYDYWKRQGIIFEPRHSRIQSLAIKKNDIKKLPMPIVYFDCSSSNNGHLYQFHDGK